MRHYLPNREVRKFRLHENSIKPKRQINTFSVAKNYNPGSQKDIQLGELDPEIEAMPIIL